jgi:metallo-beta-lactamase family protein
MATIQFFGAAGEVTGSCFLLSIDGRKVLVDCGMIQGTPADEARNFEPFPFEPAGIDAVILTHAHLDHSGLLPLLVKRGYNGPIYCHTATRDLCNIMLRDAADINEKEAAWENKKRDRKGLSLCEPLYTMADTERTLQSLSTLPYGKCYQLLPGLEMQLQDAGHILGSSIVELWLHEKSGTRKLVFSGDLGHREAPVMHNPSQISDADMVIMECTYGDRLHRSWESTMQEMQEILDSAAQSGGNVLIPAFAVGRTQDLLYCFGRNFQQWEMKHWSIYLDSPMAIEATEVYSRHPDLYDAEARHFYSGGQKPFSPANLHLSRTTEQSMAINRIRGGAIIIAGSGMCDGGRIKHHFKHNIWRNNCHVIMVGYQAEGTLGRRLVEGARHIRLWGETVTVAAHIHTLGGFSAHADQQGLLDWYGGFKSRPPLVLVHGEEQAREGLSLQIKKHHAARVIRPEYGQTLEV